MNNSLKKKTISKEKYGIFSLVLLTIIIGYMGFSKRMLGVPDVHKNEKVIVNTAKENTYKTPTYGNLSKKNNTSSVNNQYNQYSVYNDTNKPAIKYTTSKILYVGEYYDVMDDISASHTYFGDVTHLIDVIYNNVDVNTPGEYLVVYKGCNYSGSEYCRTVNRKYIVKSKYNTNSYAKAPTWSNNNSVSCINGSNTCNTYNVKKPIATDPYSHRNLRVDLIDGNVDIHSAGTYVLIYQATTESGITSTTSKAVTITGNSNNNSNNYYNNRPSSIYITNHHEPYYDDGIYKGTLSKEYSTTNQSKVINNYEWKNRVSYTYRCDNVGMYGTDGWSYVSTNTSDNHPTYYYNFGDYSGTLNKTSFYCLEGCTEKLIPELGLCNNYGQTKQIYRTFVGVYSGTVYKTGGYNNYSGYVYLKG